MKVSTETNHIVKSDWVSQSKNQIVVSDLEALEEIFQIRLRLVGLTRRINAQDTTRLSALINIQHAMAQLEDARNIIRSAN